MCAGQHLLAQVEALGWKSSAVHAIDADPFPDIKLDLGPDRLPQINFVFGKDEFKKCRLRAGGNRIGRGSTGLEHLELEGLRLHPCAPHGRGQ